MFPKFILRDKSIKTPVSFYGLRRKRRTGPLRRLSHRTRTRIVARAKAKAKALWWATGMARVFWWGRG